VTVSGDWPHIAAAFLGLRRTSSACLLLAFVNADFGRSLVSFEGQRHRLLGRMADHDTIVEATTAGGETFFKHFYSYMDTNRKDIRNLYHPHSKVCSTLMPPRPPSLFHRLHSSKTSQPSERCRWSGMATHWRGMGPCRIFSPSFQLANTSHPRWTASPLQTSRRFRGKIPRIR